MILGCEEKHQGIQQLYGFKAMNVGLFKRLEYVFTYHNNTFCILQLALTTTY
jgi:hypothetical protein